MRDSKGSINAVRPASLTVSGGTLLVTCARGRLADLPFELMAILMGILIQYHFSLEEPGLLVPKNDR